MFHIFHILQSLVFRIVNPFLCIVNVISSEASYLISVPSPTIRSRQFSAAYVRLILPLLFPFFNGLMSLRPEVQNMLFIWLKFLAHSETAEDNNLAKLAFKRWFLHEIRAKDSQDIVIRKQRILHFKRGL